ncbi:hen1 [Anaeramoeba flamelloides]|uniref:Small RNA 2'-O-methyltransferase n=1 Tax=Anaeramoeba flamelloides TaxID=1746091 RepID=A0AAV7YQ90_9EUKA|nr:hen1 [Anaeramoeba flamelloides]
MEFYELLLPTFPLPILKNIEIPIGYTFVDPEFFGDSESESDQNDEKEKEKEINKKLFEKEKENEKETEIELKKEKEKEKQNENEKETENVKKGLELKTDFGEEIIGIFNPSMKIQRYEFVKLLINYLKVNHIVDLGCGNGFQLKKFFSDLETSIELIDALDLVKNNLTQLGDSLQSIQPFGYFKIYSVASLEEAPKSRKARLHLGSLLELDEGFIKRTRGADLVTLIEVIEHIPMKELECLSWNLFYHLSPKAVLVTTPDHEYNQDIEDYVRFMDPKNELVQYKNFSLETISELTNLKPKTNHKGKGKSNGKGKGKGKDKNKNKKNKKLDHHKSKNETFSKKKKSTFRHPDHKWEWNNTEFTNWCKEMGEKFGYDYQIGGIGKIVKTKNYPIRNSNKKFNWCSQACLFVSNQEKRDFIHKKLNQNKSLILGDVNGEIRLVDTIEKKPIVKIDHRTFEEQIIDEVWYYYRHFTYNSGYFDNLRSDHEDDDYDDYDDYSEDNEDIDNYSQNIEDENNNDVKNEHIEIEQPQQIKKPKLGIQPQQQQQINEGCVKHKEFTFTKIGDYLIRVLQNDEVEIIEGQPYILLKDERCLLTISTFLFLGKLNDLLNGSINLFHEIIFNTDFFSLMVYEDEEYITLKKN